MKIVCYSLYYVMLPANRYWQTTPYVSTGKALIVAAYSRHMLIYSIDRFRKITPSLVGGDVRLTHVQEERARQVGRWNSTCRMMRRTSRKLNQTPIFKNLRASVTTDGESRSGVVTAMRRSQKVNNW